MDPIRFDTLARSLTSSASRRGVVAGLVVGLLAPVVADPDAEAMRRKRRGKGGRSQHAAWRTADARLSLQKKKRKKKKPAPCTLDCSGGKVCGSDGCGGSCGTCGNGEICQSNMCIAAACVPACTGGRVCQPNGQCLCPPQRPHSAPAQFCPETCSECCTDYDCNFTKQCVHTHAQASICVCKSDRERDCGGGFCSQCCTAEDCIANYDFSDGVICTAPGNPQGAGLCRCPEGLTMCMGSPKYCANISTDSQNCGACGNVCTNGTTCINRQCQLPA